MSLADSNKTNRSAFALRSCFFELINVRYLKHAHFYTDASKTGELTGFAVVKHNRLSKAYDLICNHKSAPNSSVFFAELSAIYIAITHIISASPNHQCVIFSDSLSSLQSIHNQVHNDLFCKLIKSLLVAHNINLCWVPAHVGIPGNEAADVAAKAASSDSRAPLFIPPSARFFHKIGLRSIHTRRNRAIEQDRPFYTTYNKTFSTPEYNSNLSRSEQINLFRLRIGHTKLTQSYKINKISRPVCEKCTTGEILDVPHLLTRCPLSKSFLSRFPTEETSIQNLLNPNQPSTSALFKLINHLKLEHDL